MSSSSFPLLSSSPVDLVHGSTVATNAIIERKGVRTALITTRGFRTCSSSGARRVRSCTISRRSGSRPSCRTNFGWRRTSASTTAATFFRQLTRPKSRLCWTTLSRTRSNRSPSASCSLSATRNTSARSLTRRGAGGFPRPFHTKSSRSTASSSGLPQLSLTRTYLRSLRNTCHAWKKVPGDAASSGCA